MNLADIRTIKELLTPLGFSFKKSLGQNFLIDADVCPAMAEAAADRETGVLEIGPGVGVLTVECAKVAKRVIAIELDNRLKPILAKTLADYPNAEVIFGDAMELDLTAIIKEKFGDCNRVAVCANLPYYITSPIIMKLLTSKLPIDSITVMVQKEAAQRLCAQVGSRDAGAVTVAVAYYAQAQLLFQVGRESFMPVPNVDSAVIKLNVLKNPPAKVQNEEFFFSLIKACFAQRRKTLCNTVSNTLGISKEIIIDALKELELGETVRSESLTFEQLAKLSDLLYN